MFLTDINFEALKGVFPLATSCNVLKKKLIFDTEHLEKSKSLLKKESFPIQNLEKVTE